MIWRSFCKVHWCLRQEKWASPPPSLSIKARARAKAQPAARALHFSPTLVTKLKVFCLILLQICVFFVSCIAKSLFEDSPTTYLFWVPADLLTAGYSKGQRFTFASHIDGGVVCSYIGTPSKTLDRKLRIFSGLFSEPYMFNLRKDWRTINCSCCRIVHIQECHLQLPNWYGFKSGFGSFM